MFCEAANFSKFLPIKLKSESSKELENSFLEAFYEKNWHFYPEPEIALCFLAEHYFRKEKYEDGDVIIKFHFFGMFFITHGEIYHTFIKKIIIKNG